MSKTDLSMEILIAKVAEVSRQQPDSALLWIADEHPLNDYLVSQLKAHSVELITNRFDQYQLGLRAGLQTAFVDFDLSKRCSDQTNHIFFRIAKERPVVHRVINQACQYLPLNGNLWLAGYKNEGIKTHCDRASALFGNRAAISREKNQLSLARLTKQQETDSRLDDQQYTQLQQLPLAENQNYWTKPGLYGWNKIDQGSQLLISTLKTHLDPPPAAASILDIGCGYGYLSCFAAGLTPAKLVATDNCFAALEAAKANLANFEFAAVVASDAADTIEGEFELILCNPPFHQGFATTGAMHRKFLQNTKKLLAPTGQAWFVVNEFLPLENYCDQLSLCWTEVARNNGFKVFTISK